MTEPGKKSVEGMQGEFVTCECTRECCVPKKGARTRYGQYWASSLTGFIAGVIVTAIVLLPWLVFESRFEDSTRVPAVIPADDGTYEADVEEEAVPQADEGLETNDPTTEAVPEDAGTPSGGSSTN